MNANLASVLVALLSVGGATFIWFATRSWLALRAGARSRERDAWDDLLDHNSYLDERARRAELDRDYLRTVVGYARWQLAEHGIEPNPRDIVLPSERLGNGAPRRRPRPGRPVSSWSHWASREDDGPDPT